MKTRIKLKAISADGTKDKAEIIDVKSFKDFIKKFEYFSKDCLEELGPNWEWEYHFEDGSNKTWIIIDNKLREALIFAKEVKEQKGLNKKIN